MKTKATYKLFKLEMGEIKLLPPNEQISKIEEIENKYNLSSEQLKEKLESRIGTKGRRKKNIVEKAKNSDGHISPMSDKTLE